MIWIIVTFLILIFVLYNSLVSNHQKEIQSATMDNEESKNILDSSQRSTESSDRQDYEELNAEQRNLFDRIENSNDHIFITGKAGTGKSFLLQYLKRKTKKSIIVCAPTGVAALNIDARTIHSLFCLPHGFIDTSNLTVRRRTATILKHVDTLVIDEISMVRADMMDAIDVLLRQARNNDAPFGGVQIIMFGDLYQLPPIVDNRALGQFFAHNHGGFYFFHAHAWENINLHIFELSEVFRQKDEEFKKILNKMRVGDIDTNSLLEINKRAINFINKDGMINLVPTNNDASAINHKRLSQLNEKLYKYIAQIDGDASARDFPVDEILELKKGAQVMFLKNDHQCPYRWANGTLGIIDSLSDNEITVKVGVIPYSIPRETWKKIDYYYNIETRKVEERVIGQFTQFPLCLAWAITIHKAQGKTYDSVVVDMGDGAFAHGQTYVALSRCTTPDGLYLKRPLSLSDITVDPVIRSFMSQANIEKI